MPLGASRIFETLSKELKSMTDRINGIATARCYDILGFKPVKKSLKDIIFNLFAGRMNQKWSYDNDYMLVIYNEKRNGTSVTIYSKLDGEKLFECFDRQIKSNELRKVWKDHKRAYNIHQLIK